MPAIAAAVDWSDPSRPRAAAEAMLALFAGTARAQFRPFGRGAASVGAVDLGGAEGTGADPWALVAVDARFDDADVTRSALGLPREASDAALVLATYRRWGIEAPHHLRGEFAFVVCDSREGRIVAARDRFGVRPLYYASAAAGPAFMLASDPEQLLATGRIAAAPNQDAVVEYLLWTLRDPGGTFLRDVRQLPAGHVLIATRQTLFTREYRRVELPDVGGLDGAACQTELRRLFEQAVRRRMQSPRPVVAQLSGGVDSTAIVCVADRILSADAQVCPGVTAAGAVHPGLRCDETRFITAVAAAVRLPVETWDGTATHVDELQQPRAPGPTGRFVHTSGTEGDIDIAHRLGAHVVLSGMGGDQIGTPYGALEDAVVERRWADARRFLTGAPGARWSSVARTTLRTARALAPPWVGALRDSLRREAPPPPSLARHARRWRAAGPPEEAAPAPLVSHLQRRRWAQLTMPRFQLGLQIIQQHAFRRGVDVRFPFMDWDLAMFTLAIPSRLWPPPWPQERFHREALRDVLPPLIHARRSKADFTPALAHRVRRQLEPIRALFHGSAWHAAPYVDQQAAGLALSAFQDAADPTFLETWAVWGVATLEAWLRHLSRYTAAT